jgi:hypothetical protein
MAFDIPIDPQFPSLSVVPKFSSPIQRLNMLAFVHFPVRLQPWKLIKGSTTREHHAFEPDAHFQRASLALSLKPMRGMRAYRFEIFARCPGDG